ncbi:MAG: DUF1302 domain-containing protein [Endozoicomonas sp.]|uniref:DUF1302 domain-containing protein n=1 Tax=Endozoicomonas sp. TaxID=1892382 RepID=UPI003D9AE00E
MMDESSVVARTPVRALQLAPAAAGFLLTGSIALTSAHAYEFDLADGEIKATLNTTISIGTKYDMEGYETPDGSEQNENDGDRSFDGGFVSKALKLTSELELKKDNYGLFVRGTAYYDDVLMNGDNKWAENNTADVAKGLKDETGTFPGWSDEVKDNQGKGAKLQSAYVFANWEFDGGQKLDIRVGDQIHNWGETIFYSGGLMDLNAYDAALASLPGSEGDLKIAQGMVSADFAFNDQIELSAFVQYDWEKSIANGRGTFDSGEDIFVPGADFGYYRIEEIFGPLVQATGGAFPLPSAEVINQVLGNGAATADFIKVTDVSGNRNASDKGQWGTRLTIKPEALPDTEFALYYANYHASVPTFEVKIDPKSIAEAQRLLANPATAPFAPANMLANNVYARTNYSEDIEMWAASFNTKVFGYTQIAGELSYKPNAPIWVDHPDDILKYGYIGALQVLQGAGLLAGQSVPISAADPSRTIAADGQWYQSSEEVHLWDGSLSVIQPFGAVLGTDLMYVVAEAAFSQVSGLDNHDRYTGKGGSDWGGDPNSENRDELLDDFSWGYNLMLGANWNDVGIQGLDIESTLRYTHDVSGNSHYTGRFEEGEKKLNLGLTGKYDAFVAKLSLQGDADNVLRKGTLIGSLGYTF